jgi:hypothetical protein
VQQRLHDEQRVTADELVLPPLIVGVELEALAALQLAQRFLVVLDVRRRHVWLLLARRAISARFNRSSRWPRKRLEEHSHEDGVGLVFELIRRRREADGDQLVVETALA